MCLCINVLSICAFVCECEDMASAGTMRLPKPGELQDVAAAYRNSLGAYDNRRRVSLNMHLLSVLE
jgi:hypothetical protein